MIESPSLMLDPNVLQRIGEFLGADRRLGTVEQLPVRRLVADGCDKFIALDDAGEPAAFIAVSPSSYPDSARDAANSARAISDALGPDLGSSVLTPAFVGTLDDRSYSITAYCKPMSSGVWSGHFERRQLKSWILPWLTEIARRSATQGSASDDRIREPLLALARHPQASIEARRAAAAALSDFEDGLWRPRTVVAHNDLWWGNVVHGPSAEAGTPPYFVIDWGGGRIDGVPIHDLVRIAMSLRIPARSFRRTLLEHCAILECEPTQGLHYLSLAFGVLSLNLGEWSAVQFARTADSCLQYAALALE